MIPDTDTGTDGQPTAVFVRAAWAGTLIHAVLALAAVITTAARGPHAMVAAVLFVAGTAAFLAAFGRAVGRSRTDVIGIGGLYFLAGAVADRAAARTLRSALLVEVLVALAASIARPYTSVAAAWLVPMWGLGVMGLYGASHGRFSARE